MLLLFLAPCRGVPLHKWLWTVVQSLPKEYMILATAEKTEWLLLWVKIWNVKRSKYLPHFDTEAELGRTEKQSVLFALHLCFTLHQLFLDTPATPISDQWKHWTYLKAESGLSYRNQFAHRCGAATEKLFNSTKPTLCTRLGQEIWDCKLKLHGKFKWVIHSKTTCFSLCIPACTTEAHNLALFILMLLPVGGNPLLPGSQMKSWAISREGPLLSGGKPRAWLVLCCLLHICPLRARIAVRLQLLKASSEMCPEQQSMVCLLMEMDICSPALLSPN